MKRTRRNKSLLSILVAAIAVLLSTVVSYLLHIDIYYVAPFALVPTYFIRINIDAFLLILFTALFSVFMHNIPYFTPVLFSLVMLLVPLYVVMRNRDVHEALNVLGFRGHPVRAFLIALISLIPAGIVLIALSLVATHLGVNDSFKIDEKVFSLPIYVLVYAVTVGPVAEEVFFRSFLPMYMHPLLANVLFAFAHYSYGSYFEIVGAFFLGLLLYALYKLSGDIKTAIFTHMMINIISLYVMGGI